MTSMRDFKAHLRRTVQRAYGVRARRVKCGNGWSTAPDGLQLGRGRRSLVGSAKMTRRTTADAPWSSRSAKSIEPVDS